MDREIGREGRYETGRQEERQVKRVESDSYKGRKRARCRLERVKGREKERQVDRERDR